MVGAPMRSGGHNAAVDLRGGGDGCPEPPRELSPAAAKYFAWLIDRLQASEPGSSWSKIDGVLLASLAELLESEERLGVMMAENPGNEKLMRLRMQHSDRVAKLSALVGLCPRDRGRLPKPALPDDDPFAEWLAGK